MTDRTDNFNRASVNLSGNTPSDGGSAWVVHAGTWSVTVSNTVNKTATFNANETCSLESSVSDVDVQATYSILGNGGPCARLADNNNFLVVIVTATNAIMYKRVAGTFTQLGTTYGGTTAVNDVWKLTPNGTSLTARQNGTSRITATDGAGQTNTKHGLYAFSTTGDWDDFSITGLGATTGTRPLVGRGPGMALAGRGGIAGSRAA